MKEITFEDIKSANETIVTTDIKGKHLTPTHKENIRKGMAKYWDKHRKGWKTKNGYIIYSINGKKQYAHRYIMEQYLGRKLKHNEQVHHINGNKTDNRLENLELMNISEHQKKHSIINGLGKDRIGIEPTNKTTKELQLKIKELRKNGYYLKDICKAVNLSYPTVLKYCKEVI